MAKYHSGIIFDIQHFSIHDGPGIRTTIFFKGCPLNCIWCHNPESIDIKPELAVYDEFCIACGSCIQVCPEGALKLEERVILHRDLCTQCGKCAEICCSRALVMKGMKYTDKTLLNEIEGDRPFFNRSGGGITISGGEPLAQPDFLREILREAKRRDLHTVVDTSGYANWQVFESILPYINLILFDVKCFNSDLHKKFTGVNNSVILANLRKLIERDVQLIIRIPVITGINDAIDEFRHIADFIGLTGKQIPVHLLPYHKFAEQKYTRFGRPYSLKGLSAPEESHLKRLAACFLEMEIPVRVFGILK